MKSSIRLLMIIIAINLGVAKTYAQVSVGIGLSVHIAPPQLPVYTQPPCPVDGYLWTPGYWAYGDGGYYWVPGAWVAPPQTGVLWTPGYWGYDGGIYVFHNGYWGHHIGFYGGVNYGGGYMGAGFVGGEWRGGAFSYNTAVVNVNRTVVHNTYVNNTVINNNNTTINRTSFNGPGGVTAQPRPEERMAMNEHHIQATPQQRSIAQVAHNDKSQYTSVNHGRPATATMNKAEANHANPVGNPAHNRPDNNVNHPLVNHPSMPQNRPNNMQQHIQRQPVVMHKAMVQTQHPQAVRRMGGGGGHHERHA